MQTDRIDKGMIVLPPVSPTKHERLMAQVFPELPEAAAVEMGAQVPKVAPTTSAFRERGEDDRLYDNFKYFLKRKSF